MVNISRKSAINLLFFLSLFIMSCRSQPKPIGWTILRTTTSPPESAQGAVAYMSKTGEAVLFGGITSAEWLDETWIWDGKNWGRAAPINHPSAREKLAMAYDESRDRVVLFGGANAETLFDDTWEWDGLYWEIKIPANRPPGRCCHAMAYDSATNRVVVYGGYDHVRDVLLHDTWVWDGNDWTEVTCCNAPAMSGHAMANFSDKNEVVSVMTGGFGTWAWDGSIWSKLALENPPHRSEGRLAYESGRNRAIYFGGSKDGEPLNDIWMFDGVGWQEIVLHNSPSPRFGHILFYDTNRQTYILFGGYSDGLSDRTWELNLPHDVSDLIAMPTLEPEE